jgi:hypothetical protein
MGPFLTVGYWLKILPKTQKELAKCVYPTVYVVLFPPPPHPPWLKFVPDWPAVSVSR